jgi:hypothetical protein
MMQLTGAILQWAISFQAMVMLWLMGNGSRWGPRVGIAGQFLWMYYAVSTHQYGLVIGILAFTVIHIRNYRRMR